MKQHISEVDPDCIGLSEVDVPPLYQSFQEDLKLLGYDGYFVEKSNNITGSAIFWKSNKFVCLEKVH